MRCAAFSSRRTQSRPWTPSRAGTQCLSLRAPPVCFPAHGRNASLRRRRAGPGLDPGRCPHRPVGNRARLAHAAVRDPRCAAFSSPRRRPRPNFTVPTSDPGPGSNPEAGSAPGRRQAPVEPPNRRRATRKSRRPPALLSQEQAPRGHDEECGSAPAVCGSIGWPFETLRITRPTDPGRQCARAGPPAGTPRGPGAQAPALSRAALLFT